MSLLYECIQTVIVGGMIAPEASSEDASAEANETVLARLCVSKLKLFIEDRDPNLKYLGLHALSKLLPLRPKAVTEHRDIILECLEDKDISIRMRALEIVTGMVTKRNLPDIVKRLLLQIIPEDGEENEDAPVSPVRLPVKSLVASDATYNTEVISRILAICSKNTYEMVSDFAWYINILIAMIRVPRVSVGNQIAAQIVDVAVRVKNVREFAVKEMEKLLSDESLLETAVLEENNAGVLFAAAWVVGEYSSYVSNYTTILEHLLAPGVTKLPPHIQSVFVHATLKVYSTWISKIYTSVTTKEDFEHVTNAYKDGLSKFMTSMDLEVQERASTAFHIVNLIKVTEPAEGDAWTIPPVAIELGMLFGSELNPVAPKAQSLVPVPEGLDLESWIYEPEPEVAEGDSESDYTHEDPGFWGESPKKKYVEEDQETKDKRRKERMEKRRNDPFYIGGPEIPDIDVDSIPIVKLDLGGVELPKRTSSKPSSKKSTKSKKSKFASMLPEPGTSSTTAYEINRDVEMPANVNLADLTAEDSKRTKDIFDADTLAVMSVDLTAPDENGLTAFGPSKGREAVMTSAVPKFQSSEVPVVRRKVVSAEAATKKKKSSKKKEDGEDQAAGKKEKKSKKKAKGS
ncbi:AP-3 complex subunit delta-1, partial [Chytridiales sp. JEL 0842]